VLLRAGSCSACGSRPATPANPHPSGGVGDLGETGTLGCDEIAQVIAGPVSDHDEPHIAATVHTPADAPVRHIVDAQFDARPHPKLRQVLIIGGQSGFVHVLPVTDHGSRPGRPLFHPDAVEPDVMAVFVPWDVLGLSGEAIGDLPLFEPAPA
jgi:hypothetical protein